MPRTHGTRRLPKATSALAVASWFLLSACSSTVGGAGGTVAMIPGYQGGAAATPAPPQGYPVDQQVVSVTLGENSSTDMFIDMSQDFAPTGKVSFLVTNTGTETHEFVALQTETAAADFPIVSFEGEADRIDEEAKGVINVGETGDMEPGTSQMLTIDMSSGHYAVVCNLPKHYANGMHEDFWVTPRTLVTTD